MAAIISGLSAAGVVFGIQHTLVIPPAAAAAVPVMISSLWVWPGSRRWTCMSTKPGAATKPAQSMAWSGSPERAAAMRPSSKNRLPT